MNSTFKLVAPALYFFFTVLLSPLSSFSQSSLNSDPLQPSFGKMIQKSEFIHQKFKIYESATLELAYTNTLDKIELAKADPTDENLSNANLYYNKLAAMASFYDEIESKKGMWATQYFRLWERAFVLKEKINKLYRKEETKNSYGTSNLETVTRIHKKEIYLAGQAVTDEYLRRLRSSAECDYYSKIEITEDMIEFLKKMEEIYIADDTKELRKALKNTNSLNKQHELIMNFDKTS